MAEIMGLVWRAGQLFGKANRGAHAGGIGFALPGNVVGSAVVGRRSDEGQTERPVDTVFEGDHFQRSQPLVVIHRHNRVVVPAISVIEQCVRRKRPDDIQPSLSQRIDHRLDHGDFLVPKFAAFSGMRIQAADRHTSAGQT